MIIKIAPGGDERRYERILPPLRSIAEGISEDINALIERFEEDGPTVEVTLDYMHGNILILGITAFGSNHDSVIFTSLNLWQYEGDDYVFNMQDGKVYGFEMASLKDYKTLTPVEFVEHVLHDLFYGW